MVSAPYFVIEGSDVSAYLEPAYLFSGTFNQGGTAFEKRVLVPALVASALST
jgi:hypothetical protein